MGGILKNQKKNPNFYFWVFFENPPPYAIQKAKGYIFSTAKNFIGQIARLNSIWNDF